ncbi:MAG: HAD hydrolase-like protein [Victivallales bacterium]|nr:HAD hydrolase-like protein [Victivallales bacterium]
MNKILIFDLDGTLIDSREDLAYAVNLTRADYGLPPLSLQTVVSYVGDGIYNQMKRGFSDATFDWDLEEVVNVDRKHYSEHLLDKTKAYPGVIETLQKLKSEFKLAVVTNKPDDCARTILGGLGILPLLDTVVGGGRTVKLKPDPEPLRLAMAETQSGTEGSWVVGDHRTDLGAAVNTGLKGCFCAYGFGIQDNQPADAIIHSFPELAEILLN